MEAAALCMKGGESEAKNGATAQRVEEEAAEENKKPQVAVVGQELSIHYQVSYGSIPQVLHDSGEKGSRRRLGRSRLVVAITTRGI